MDVNVRASIRKVARNDARAFRARSGGIGRHRARLGCGCMAHSARQPSGSRWPGRTARPQGPRDHRARRGRRSHPHRCRSGGPGSGAGVPARPGSLLRDGLDAAGRRRGIVRIARGVASSRGPAISGASISGGRRARRRTSRRVDPGPDPGIYRRRECRPRVAAQPPLRILAAREPAAGLARRGYDPLRARHVSAASRFFGPRPVAARPAARGAAGGLVAIPGGGRDRRRGGHRRQPRCHARHSRGGGSRHAQTDRPAGGTAGTGLATPRARQQQLGGRGIADRQRRRDRRQRHAPRLQGSHHLVPRQDAPDRRGGRSMPSGSRCPARLPSWRAATATSPGASPTATENSPGSSGWSPRRGPTPTAISLPTGPTSCATWTSRSRSKAVQPSISRSL